MRPNAVALGQTLIVLLFMAEYLDDLLAVDHFFYIAIEVGQRLLLRHEIAADLHRELLTGSMTRNSARHTTTVRPVLV